MPPPLQSQVPRLVPAPCLRRACDMRATKGRRQCPPPHTPPPPQGGGMKEGRGGQRPPPPRIKQQGGEAAERGCGRDHKTVPEGSTRRASPSGGGTGDANAGWEGRRREPHGKPPPPPCRGTSAAPRACAVLATCLRQRTDSEGAPPPLHPRLPHPPRKGASIARSWRGDMGGGQRTDQHARGRDGRRAVETQKKKKKRKKQTNAPGEESEKTGTKTAANGGRPGRHGTARDTGEEPDHGGMGAPKGRPPPPTAASPCACVVLASKGRRQGRQGGGR